MLDSQFLILNPGEQQRNAGFLRMGIWNSELSIGQILSPGTQRFSITSKGAIS
jgi:hypothetical protein